MKKAIGRSALSALGWTLGYENPLTDRYVLAVAPHTSNWDFPLGLMAAWALELDAHWIGKHTLFKGPLGPFFRSVGGIPVDRGAARDMVEQMAERFAREERLVLALAPEGTREGSDHWKSGFWRIARAAEVPIALAYLDWGRRELGLGGTFMPTDDREADFARIRAFYADRQGRFPEKQGEIRPRGTRH
ncbi:MAG: lysophospholipid acyltransferase family protein [Pseudomonadota bacterium]